MFKSRILADSLSPEGTRLTTFEVTYPLYVHNEFMTHRVVSRNAASSRAIPAAKTLAAVMEDPVIPIEWGTMQAGMQAGPALVGSEAETAERRWLDGRDWMVRVVRELTDLKVHKQTTNRLLNPFMWITTIASATDWANFFSLRLSQMAEPHIRRAAEMMVEDYINHEPTELAPGDWHLPLVYEPDYNYAAGIVAGTRPNYFKLGGDTIYVDDATDFLKHISAARCARVSYLTHDGRRDYYADIELHNKLARSGHWSPFEHVASPCDHAATISRLVDLAPGDGSVEIRCALSGNFDGFHQYRKSFDHERAREFVFDGGLYDSRGFYLSELGDVEDLGFDGRGDRTPPVDDRPIQDRD
jgi:hypothetical protein